MLKGKRQTRNKNRNTRKKVIRSCRYLQSTNTVYWQEDATVEGFSRGYLQAEKNLESTPYCLIQGTVEKIDRETPNRDFSCTKRQGMALIGHVTLKLKTQSKYRRMAKRWVQNELGQKNGYSLEYLDSQGTPCLENDSRLNYITLFRGGWELGELKSLPFVQWTG